MTETEILEKLDVQGAELRISDNAGYYWIAVERTHNDTRYSHSARLDLNPTDEQIANVRQMFSIWWADTIRDQ